MPPLRGLSPVIDEKPIGQPNWFSQPSGWTNFCRSFQQAGLGFRNGVEQLRLRLFSDLTRDDDSYLLF
jgi:hypothetical protein